MFGYTPGDVSQGKIATIRKEDPKRADFATLVNRAGQFLAGIAGGAIAEGFVDDPENEAEVRDANSYGAELGTTAWDGIVDLATAIAAPEIRVEPIRRDHGTIDTKNGTPKRDHAPVYDIPPASRLGGVPVNGRVRG